MSEDEVIRILHEYFESLFPKVCPKCKYHYSSLREYIRVTKRLKPAISWDAELENWETTMPIGSMVMVVCPCGTTLCLSTQSIELPLGLELLNWLRVETQRRGIMPSELLEHLRDRVRNRVDPMDGK